MLVSRYLIKLKNNIIRILGIFGMNIHGRNIFQPDGRAFFTKFLINAARQKIKAD